MTTSKPVPVDRESQLKQMKRNLVESAIDFFQHGFDECGCMETKYAVLHLATAVELFMKARLIDEHWALVFPRQQDFTLDELLSGKARTLFLNDAMKRLNCILRIEEQLHPNDIKILTELNEERNKIVHFYHADIQADANQELVKRQVRVWFVLKRLLREKWTQYFFDYNEQLQNIENRMLEKKSYLSVVYENVKSELEDLRKAGMTVTECPSCGYTAYCANPDAGFQTATCHVCKYMDDVLAIHCVGCGKPIILTDGYSVCPLCNKAYSPKELANKLRLTVEYEQYQNTHINCFECSSEDVYPYKAHFICLCCFSRFHEVHHCDYCGEPYAGEYREATWVTGCGNFGCHGKDID